MNKCKIAKKKGMRKLLIKPIKGQQLSEREYLDINNNEVPGLLHVDVQRDGTLEYDITGLMPLSEFLRFQITKPLFAQILQNIVMNLNAIQKGYFNEQLVLMEVDKVFVNPSSQGVFFVYVPLQPFENESSLREMLLDIVQFCSFDEQEDNSYVSEYITILNSGVNFSRVDLEQYVDRLVNGTGEEEETVECPKCHTMVPASTAFCNRCGFKLFGNTGDFGGSAPTGGPDLAATYDMFSTQEEVYQEPAEEAYPEEPREAYPEEPREVYPEEPREVYPEEPREVYPEEPREVYREEPRETIGVSTPGSGRNYSLNKGTTVLGAAVPGTTVLGAAEPEEKPQRFPYLIREKTGERIEINKKSFRIGREYRDYLVDNRYVSSAHVDVLTRNGRYFIVDLNSTNRTYLDGVALAPNRETEIFPGSGLKLANEKFSFCLDE